MANPQLKVNQDTCVIDEEFDEIFDFDTFLYVQIENSVYNNQHQFETQ